MDDQYGARYAALYYGHWWWRARESYLLDLLRRLRPPGGWPRILDVGCGDGLFFDQLAAFGSVEGVESDSRLLRPDGPHRSRIHLGPFDRTYTPGHTFDLILMLDVLEHLPDAQSALTRVYELLSPTGLLVATVPAFQTLWTRHDDLNHHMTRYRRRTIAPLLSAARLAPVEMRYFFHWLAPLKLLVRLTQWAIPASGGVPDVPSALVRRVLVGWSRIEQRLFDRLHLPFGSSLLVVARRTT